MNTRTPAEIAYDATRLSYGPIADPEIEIAAWIDQAPEAQPAPIDTMIEILDRVCGPEVLPLDAARAHARRNWAGHTTTNDEGEFRRYPELPPVEIGALFDGTPVLGAFDNDDSPRTVDLHWGGFSIIADAEGFDFGDDTRDYGHVTYE